MRWFVLGLCLLGCREQDMAKELDLGACAGTIPLACSTSCALPTCPTSRPSYEDVLPIFQQHCVVCHTANGIESQRPYDTYAQVVSQWGSILDSIYGCTMPKAGDVHDELSPDDRVKLETWLVCGPVDAGTGP